MGNQKPIDGPQKRNGDVIKSSSTVTQKDNPKIPIQYSTFDNFNLSSHSSIANAMNVPAFINALSVDWKVGFQFWCKLTEDLKKKVQDVRDHHLPPHSGGDSHQNRN